jgi:hypothetical protein
VHRLLLPADIAVEEANLSGTRRMAWSIMRSDPVVLDSESQDYARRPNQQRPALQ